MDIKKTLLNENFKHALRSKNDPVLYVKYLQSKLKGEKHKKYATAENYVESITAVMKMWKMIK